MKPETALLFALARARPELDRVRDLAAGPLDWGVLTGLAALNRTLPLSRRNLLRAGLDVPEPHRRTWASEQDRVREVNTARREWTARFLEAADGRGIDVLLLKGIGLAETIYADCAYKQMNDADVLVRPEAVAATRGLLEGLGFVCVTDLFGKSIFPEGSHHCPPYLSPDRRCVVGLHWGLVSPKGPFQPDMAALWAQAERIPYGHTRAWRMSWEDTILHLAIHLPFYKTGVRELMDVFNVARVGGYDAGRLAAKVARAGAEPAALRVLGLAEAMAPGTFPADLLARWRPRAGALVRRDLDRRVADPDRLARSRSVHLADIEREQVVFLLSRNLAERLAAWRGTWRRFLAPSEAEQERLLGRARRTSPPDRLADRVEVSARTWAALALDHGHLPLLGFVVGSPLLLARTALRQLSAGPAPRLRDHPAAELLEILE